MLKPQITKEGRKPRYSIGAFRGKFLISRADDGVNPLNASLLNC